MAGFDTAVYGLAKESFPILFHLPGREGCGDVLVATTKLSNFVTGRYAPYDAWQSIWSRVFAWLQPGKKLSGLNWTPHVRPSFRADEALPANVEGQALRRGIEWYFNSRMVVHPSMMAKYDRPANEPLPPSADPDLSRDWPYGQAEERLAAFLCRIQIRSEAHGELDGGWFRAFDFKRWEYWASSADVGWGAWSIESGWTQSWITSVLALRLMKTSLWDFTRQSRIAAPFEKHRRQMLSED